MYARWIFLIFILYLQWETVISQYYDSNEQYFEEPEDMHDTDYDDEPYHNNHRKRFSHKNMYTRTNPDDCKCSCQRCKNSEPNLCCKEVCSYCQQMNTNYDAQNQENPNLVFVPYPVPLVVPNIYKNNSIDATTSETPVETTTKVEITTTEKSTEKALRINSLEEMLTGHHRTMKELNPDTKMKSRPSWVPKYGIVPIPDRLAAKLMSQLVEVRSVKGKKMLRNV